VNFWVNLLSEFMLITFLADFQYVIDLPLFLTSEWQPVHKRFPLSTSNYFAFDHPGQRDRCQLTLSHDVSHKSHLSINSHSADSVMCWLFEVHLHLTESFEVKRYQIKCLVRTKMIVRPMLSLANNRHSPHLHLTAGNESCYRLHA